MFKIGDKVRYYDDPECIGTVVSFDERGPCYQIDDNGDIQNVYEDALRLFDPEGDAARANIIQDKINKATSAFELAFETLKDAIHIGDRFGELKGLDIDVSKLQLIMDQMGWRSSTLEC